ncbi:MAG TPA: hypothetical protein VIO84_00095 [Candidatus Dormibacteraeota bacterium]|jgi:hypothetical protein
MTDPELSAKRPSQGQAPGEDMVQVNDRYAGGGPPPEQESPTEEEQHPTGG